MKIGYVSCLAGLLAVSGCGQQAHLTHHHAKTQHDSGPLPREARPRVTPQNLRLVATHLPMLMDSGQLPAREERFLEAHVPRALPLIPRATVRVPARGLRGKYWLGVGFAGANQAPGPCLYWQASGHGGIGADCFPMRMISSGRAVSLFGRPPRVEVIGIVPSGTRRAVALGTSGRIARLQLHRQTYFGRLRFEPQKLEVSLSSGRRVAISLR